MYTITLADGTKLKNLELNGNNYIAEGVIEDSVFEGNLDTVKITDGETTETFTDMRLMSNIVRDNRSWFVLGEKSAQQKKEEAMEKQMAEMQKAMSVLLTGGGIRNEQSDTTRFGNENCFAVFRRDAGR